MPRFQLEIAVALNVSATVSAVLLYLNRSNAKEGKIRLPLHAASDAPQIASEEMYPDGDPFDVTTSEDLLDGYPLQEEKFWTQMRRRKIFLSITIFLLVLVQAARPVLGGDIAICTLNLVFALYLFAVAAFSVTRQTVRLHTESVWHLASLTTLAAPLMGFTAILPGEDLPVLTIEDSILPGLCASPLSILFFSYSTPVVMLGNTAASLEIGDLPILTVDMRATLHYASLKRALLSVKLPKILSWRSPQVGSGLALLYQLGWVNSAGLAALTALSLVVGSLFYIPPFFMSRVLTYLENDPQREHPEWGWVWVVCLFGSNVLLFVGQLWSLTTATLQARIRAQLNTVLFAKTLVRKDVASSAAVAKAEDADAPESDAPAPDADGFSSKAQIMTLMTTDIDRVARFTHQLFVIIDAPIEIAVGTIFLYNLLGVSCFFGLGVAILCLPLNHFAGKTISGAQDNLMKARGRARSVLGGIRMFKFMAWERSFEVRIMKIRTKELEYQRLNYIIEALLTGLWNMTPIVVTLVSFYHFAVVRGEALTPSIAFTSVLFNELKFALAAVPETLIAALQGIISLRRIEKYLHTPEVTPVPPIRKQSQDIAFQSCTVTWPQDRSPSSSVLPSFILMDLTLKFPPGELSLICGKLGSGKTLLLLALLGEADILGGQMLCPRSPADSLASFAGTHPTKEDWVIAGICAYVPQAAWLQNASIKDNILFNLPYDEERYKLTLEICHINSFLRVCALVSDLEILEDGDESEIGERGVNLSGGQKARVSLARAVYSRASILLLDDVLAAVDAHTAHHLYHSCLRGELMRGRTVILVSHHVQLCTPGAGYVVALDNGRVQFQGSRDEFQSSVVMRSLVQSTSVQDAAKEETAVDAAHIAENESDAVVAEPIPADKEKKQPRKFFEEEQRAVGRVAWAVWKTYILACGSGWYWVLFVLMFLIAAIAPVLENGWLSYWSRGDDSNSPVFYLTIYTALLQAVLFANIRFHDTISRGRLLNRFGKDFEGIDSTLPGSFGNTTIYFVSTLTTVITISFIGGPPFVVGAFLVSIYGQTCRDLRRLGTCQSTRSPLYSMYSETITGVTILRAFGASSKFLRDMLRAVDTNCNPSYWTWGVNRWLSVRIPPALVALLAVLNKDISASLAGFALAFSSTITFDLLLLVREFVGLEQAMVGLERVKEYSDLSQESAEFIEPRPEPSWPEHGAIRCENLVIRYAPDLPDVLHNVTFDVKPGEKIGILGRTGSGKSTLALSFFRFVEATEGQIVVDGLDISKIGLTDLRSRLTIIPQDPTILSGTIRTTLDVFSEYEDADIFEALHTPEEAADAVNTNLFRNLDSSVSEGGENFSTGEKQLLCMARAILKRSKILVMDEVGVDYATDELIGKTIRHEFKASTILTIAHRLRTVIDYDKVMLLDQGKIAEFDRPSVLLANKSSKFYALCKAAGKEEFEMLKKMAGL
ncbi:multidrug resistance-associated ABC transporter [Mycena olivaceomarginata]|nr:multidrug resistance-associated ABC transporter [Mycena olivaceomarginata]